MAKYLFIYITAKYCISIFTFAWRYSRLVLFKMGSESIVLVVKESPKFVGDVMYSFIFPASEPLLFFWIDKIHFIIKFFDFNIISSFFLDME